jgi:CAAX protease family protein
MTSSSRRARDAVIAVIVALAAPSLVSAAVHLSGAHLNVATRAITGDLIPASAAVFLVTKWRWWKPIGWQAPVWGDLYVMWLPALLLVFAIIQGTPYLRDASVSAVVAGALAALVVGFTEEVWFRGLLLEGLRPRGARAAVFGSALVFGVIHLANFRVLGLASVITQSLGALAIGLMFGAVRVRIGSLVPLVLIHAAFDVAYLAGTAPSPRPITSQGLRVLLVIIAIALIYTLVLTRRSVTVLDSVSEVVPTLG